jgi:glycine cleavage system H lipoate-binding protein
MNARKKQISNEGVSESPQHCWWMRAGIVDYKLCDHDFDCDNCPFDRVIHGSRPNSLHKQISSASYVVPTPIHQGKAGDTRSRSVHGCEIPTSLFYHPAHIWARIEDGGCVRTGLDDFGQRVLGRPYTVGLPNPGSKVWAGEPCWYFIHNLGETKLISPVSGRVKEVNHRLSQYPTLLNRDPYGLGWVFVIEPEDLNTSLKELMYGQRVTDWCEQEFETLSRLLNEDSHGNSHPGRTIGDGGVVRNDFAADLNAEQIRKIISSFFSISPSKNEETEAILVTVRR